MSQLKPKETYLTLLFMEPGLFKNTKIWYQSKRIWTSTYHVKALKTSQC